MRPLRIQKMDDAFLYARTQQSELMNEIIHEQGIRLK